MIIDREIYQARTKEFIDTISFVADDFAGISIGIKRYLEKGRIN